MKNLVCTTKDNVQKGAVEVTLNRLEKDGDLTSLKTYNYFCQQKYVRSEQVAMWDANYKWVNVPNEARERKAHGKLLDWYLKNLA